MEFDTLNQVQLINFDNEYNHLLLGNKKGYIAVPVDEEYSEMITTSLYNYPNPLVTSEISMLKFCGVKKNLQIKISSQIDEDRYLATLDIGEKTVGKYPLNELIYYIQTAMPKILVNKQLLEFEGYNDISKNNLKLSQLVINKKTLPISTPLQTEKMSFSKLDKEYLMLEDDESRLIYNITFSNSEVYIKLKNLASRTPDSVHEKLLDDNALLLEDFLPKENTLYNSLLDLFKMQNIKVKEVLLHDITYMDNKEIFVNSNINTMSLLLNNKKTSRRFLVPQSVGIAFAIKLKKMDIRTPKITITTNPTDMYN